MSTIKFVDTILQDLAANLKMTLLDAYDSQGDLHDQCHRIGEHESAQDYQEPGLVSQRRGAEQVVLLGAEKHQPKMEYADSRLEGRAESV